MWQSFRSVRASYPQLRVHPLVVVGVVVSVRVDMSNFENMFDQRAAQATSSSGGAAVGAWARVENAAGGAAAGGDGRSARAPLGRGRVGRAGSVVSGQLDRGGLRGRRRPGDLVGGGVASVADRDGAAGTAGPCGRGVPDRADQPAAGVDDRVPHRVDHPMRRPAPRSMSNSPRWCRGGVVCRRPRSSRKSTTLWTAMTRMRCGGWTAKPAGVRPHKSAVLRMSQGELWPCVTDEPLP